MVRASWREKEGQDEDEDEGLGSCALRRLGTGSRSLEQVKSGVKRQGSALHDCASRASRVGTLAKKLLADVITKYLPCSSWRISCHVVSTMLALTGNWLAHELTE